MKKNKMMRAASFLLVAVLLTTSVISGTFAKYVTTATGSDTARVAKWGVTASVTGTAFAKEYDIKTPVNDVNGDAITVSVSSTENVVAPGTSGTFTGVALTGTPEVAVEVVNEATVTLTGWNLASGYYCPLVVTVEGDTISGLDFTSTTDFAAAIEAAIEAGNGKYQANTDLASIDKLNGDYTWTWAYAGDDEKDTELGDAAAAGSASTITLAVTTTVTQID